MTTVEMTTAEQQQYLHHMHDDKSGSRLATLTQGCLMDMQGAYRLWKEDILP